jgi:hypothetical protein
METLQLRKSVFPVARLDASPQWQKSYEDPNGTADASHREQNSTRRSTR